MFPRRLTLTGCVSFQKKDEGGGWGQTVKEWRRGCWEEIWHQKGVCERTTVKLRRMQWEAQLEE